jgi:hypothetical protein
MVVFVFQISRFWARKMAIKHAKNEFFVIFWIFLKFLSVCLKTKNYDKIRKVSSGNDYGFDGRGSSFDCCQRRKIRIDEFASPQPFAGTERRTSGRFKGSVGKCPATATERGELEINFRTEFVAYFLCFMNKCKNEFFVIFRIFLAPQKLKGLNVYPCLFLKI